MEGLKCGAGEGWWRSVGLIMWEMWCWRWLVEISWTDHVGNVVLEMVGGDQLD
jgi:hypothetical protein